MSDPRDVLYYIKVPTRITKSDVYFGDEKVPGCIEENGIVFTPGGYKSLNRLTVTFLVGEVLFEDPQRISHPDEERSSA